MVRKNSRFKDSYQRGKPQSMSLVEESRLGKEEKNNISFSQVSVSLSINKTPSISEHGGAEMASKPRDAQYLRTRKRGKKSSRYSLVSITELKNSCNKYSLSKYSGLDMLNDCPSP